MHNYEIQFKVPVQAVSDQAASAAALQVYDQLRLILCTGIHTPEYVVPQPGEAGFSQAAATKKCD